MKEWFANEKFWKTTYPFMFSEKKFLEGINSSEKIIKLLKFKGTKILDLCCGPGRISIPLAQTGKYEVTAVDKSPFLLNCLKRNALNNKAGLTFIRDDMRSYIKPLYYDLVMNMFTSFGYFENKDEDIQVLNNIFASLKPGGKFIIDVMGKEILARIYRDTVTDSIENGDMIVQKHEITCNWTRIKNEWLVINPNNKVKRFNFTFTIYSAKELSDKIKAAGFKNIHVYGNLDGTPYDSEAERLIITAEKQTR